MVAIPGYEVLGELGRGGMGVVYKARQVNLNRVVALKTVIRADVGAGAIVRFWAEAEVMAAVRHPHVVPVYDLGEFEGRPFLAMEYLPGGTLAGRLESATPVPPADAAGLVGKVAAGVAAAHDLGVVHRDLKPGNVLLDATGEPKVSDFGLAKRASHDLTQTSALMGTPAYMAPEQAGMRAKFVGPPADVWALGVILYECVSGRRPFEADTVEELLAAITSAEPPPLRAGGRGVPRDLETIASKCLAKEPEYRYPTAGELAADLGRFARGEPIAARPVGTAEGVVRWVRRKPTTAAVWGVSALAVGLALVAFVVAGLWRTAEGAKHDAETARDQLTGANAQLDHAYRKEATNALQLADANSRLDDALRRERSNSGQLADANGKLAQTTRDLERANQTIELQNYAHLVSLARRDYEAADLGKARDRLAACPEPLRRWEWHHLHRLCHQDQVTLTGHADAVWVVAWSPDGRRVASGGRDDTARLWDVETGRELVVLRGHKGHVAAAEWSPDGRLLVTVAWDNTPRVWDGDRGHEVAALAGHTSLVEGVTWSPDGARVVTASRDKTARVWDAGNWRTSAVLKGHTDTVASAGWTPDGTRVVTTSGDQTARVWDPATGRELVAFRFTSTTRPVWSPDGRLLATTGEDNVVRVWDAESGDEAVALRGHTAAIWLVRWSPDGKHLVSSSEDQSARVWDVAAGREVAVLRAPNARPGVVVSWDPRGTRVVAACDDRAVRVWDARTGTQLAALRGHTVAIGKVAWAPDGRRLATAGWDRTVRLWDLGVLPEGPTLSGHTDVVEWAAWSPDGTRVVTASQDKTARVWDAATGAAILTLAGHVGGVKSAAWSPDGAYVATLGQDDTARVWAADTGREVRRLPCQSNLTVGVRWDPAGTRVLLLGVGTAAVWDARTGRRVGSLGTGSAVGWSRDQTRVAIAGYDKTVVVMPAARLRLTPPREEGVVWLDGPGGAGTAILRGHSHVINTVSWSPVDERLATACWDGTVRVWDADAGRELLRIDSQTGSQVEVAWSPDGARLVTAPQGAGPLRVWDASTGKELLALPGKDVAAWSPDGSRLLTCGPGPAAQIYDTRPVNRAFLPPPEVAPPPRPVR